MIRALLDPGNYSVNVNIGLFFSRLATSVLMLGHGWGKLLRLFGAGPISFADPVGLGPAVTLALTVFAEVFCSVLLIVGLGTRISVVPLIITMAVAVLVVHADDPFGRKELALLYLVVYVTTAFVGAGRYSLDNLLFKKLNR